MSMPNAIERIARGAARLNLAHLGLLGLVLVFGVLAHRWGLSPLAVTIFGLVLILGCLGLAEWLRPHRRDWHPGAKDLRRDATFFGANVVADSAADAILRLALPALAAAIAPARGAWAAELPLWMATIAALWLSELPAYWLHRLSHRGGWLWRVHAVHHRPAAVNVSNDFTTHPINVLLDKVVRIAPLVLLGFSPEAIVLAGLFNQAQSFAAHANTAGTLGWLNYVIGTAELHRRHHGTDPAQALNFGTAVPLWDQVFGTFRWRGSAEPSAVGLAEPADYPGARDTIALLIEPLR